MAGKQATFEIVQVRSEMHSIRMAVFRRGKRKVTHRRPAHRLWKGRRTFAMSGELIGAIDVLRNASESSSAWIIGDMD